jgi:hypothetical protein
MDIAIVGKTIFRSLTLRLAAARLVFLWSAVLMVFGIGVWQVYLSEKIVANAILTEILFRGGVKPDRQQEAK